MLNLIYICHFANPTIISSIKIAKVVTERVKIGWAFMWFVENAANPDYVTHIDDIPIREHPDYLAVYKTRDEILKRVIKGEFSDYAEVVSDFNTELKFRHIVANENFSAS